MNLVLAATSNGDQARAYLWVFMGLALGAVIGFEREYRGHEAGIRTAALVCGGATIFTQVSVLFGDSRVAAGVVQGIGFLGAGLVIQRGRSVRGVTTATTIWVVAAIGVLVGEELWLTAVLVTGTVVVILELAPVSNWVLEHGAPQPGHSRNDGAGTTEAAANVREA